MLPWSVVSMAEVLFKCDSATDSSSRVEQLQNEYRERLTKPGGAQRLGAISHRFFGEGGEFTADVNQFKQVSKMTPRLAQAT